MQRESLRPAPSPVSREPGWSGDSTISPTPALPESHALAAGKTWPSASRTCYVATSRTPAFRI
eukprot:9190634-Heterocapsa_arctica.AAC.1